MNIPEVLALFDKEQRIEIEYPGVRKETLPQVVRFVRPAPGMNFILYSWLDENTMDAVLQEQVAYFAPLGQPFEWIAYEHDTPPHLWERLAAQGFAPDDDPSALMALDLREAPPALLEPVTGDKNRVDIRPITTRDGLADVIQVMEQVYGGNYAWIRQRLGDHLEIPGYLSVYVAYVEGQPACAGWIYFYPGSHFAGLWGGSTVAEYRKRGLYTAVLATRVQEAIRRGYRYLTIDASPMSRPIVARHGFHLLTMCHSRRWSGTPAT